MRQKEPYRGWTAAEGDMGVEQLLTGNADVMGYADNADECAGRARIGWLVARLVRSPRIP